MSRGKSSESVLSDESEVSRAKSVEFLDDDSAEPGSGKSKVKKSRSRSKLGSLLRSKSLKTKTKEEWKGTM